MKRRIELDLTDHEINQLRDVMDRLPIGVFGPLVVTVLKALPLNLESSDAHRRVHEMVYHESTVGTVDPAAAESSRSSTCGGGFAIRAISERGRAAMPHLESRLLAAGIPWTREEV